MGNPYSRAPHGGAVPGVAEAPHAALLIDFDNVTMGMRSDLSKELKTLLDSDIIKGKVSVQRAYADWRRYPQYIVPLSEASVDLIFAPAYGSNKKNATDIRMAIDAVELVFIRPEIGTFILLTGDSDFSSLVLKLKEYGKYIIGVGIQESTSDILVQNCDEYYSYTSLSGLKQTTEAEHKAQDPWVLVKDALKKMSDRGDVMRSDRLKQVMQELDSSFDEGSLGFSKFSRFLTEASSRGLVKLHKMDNGQYEVALPKGRGRRDDGEGRGGRQDRGRSRGDRRAQGSTPDRAARSEEQDTDPLQDAYRLLTAALEDLRRTGRDPVRDSDLKRKMLELDRSFDEAELGFPKFSRFLAQAGDHEVVRLTRTEEGTTEVSLASGGAVGRTEPAEAKPPAAERADRAREETPPRARAEERETDAPEAPEEPRAPDVPEPSETEPSPTVIEVDPSELGSGKLRLGPRLGTTRRRDAQGPVLFAGQAVAQSSGKGARHEGRPYGGDASEERAGSRLDASALGLPTDPDAIVRYLAHRYRGVGEKTAESLVERFGTDLFQALRDDPAAIAEAVSPKRAEQVLEAWSLDYQRRVARMSGDGEGSGSGGRRSGDDRGEARHRDSRDRDDR